MVGTIYERAWWFFSSVAEICSSLHWDPRGSCLKCNSGTAAGKRGESIWGREAMTTMLLAAPTRFCISVSAWFPWWKWTAMTGVHGSWFVSQLPHSHSLASSTTVVLLLLVGWSLPWWWQILVVTGLPVGGSLGPPQMGWCHRALP